MLWVPVFLRSISVTKRPRFYIDGWVAVAVMDSGVIEGGLNVTLTIRLLMHGKVSSPINCLCLHSGVYDALFMESCPFERTGTLMRWVGILSWCCNVFRNGFVWFVHLKFESQVFPYDISWLHWSVVVKFETRKQKIALPSVWKPNTRGVSLVSQLAFFYYGFKIWCVITVKTNRFPEFHLAKVEFTVPRVCPFMLVFGRVNDYGNTHTDSPGNTSST